MLRKKDIPLWEDAKVHLDVRTNDEHTLHSYNLGQQLLTHYPKANKNIILPAIILHDTGWKKIPKNKILKAFGPNNKYPELQRKHELESVKIAKKLLKRHGYRKGKIDSICAIIDGHDTDKSARSLDDAIMKDSDKLWRYTPHGVATIQSWFGISVAEVLDILRDFVLPRFLTKQGKSTAISFLAYSEMQDAINQKRYL